MGIQRGLAQGREGTSQMHPSHPPTGQRNDMSGALAGRASTLLDRIVDVEQALAIQEWWLLGRVAREAGLLSEIASLLAVARGELEEFLVQFFGRPIASGEPADAFDPQPPQLDDPTWIRASREQAAGLLRMVASALPAMQQYAQMLRTNAERLQMPVAALDALGIVADRLGEAYETIHPPHDGREDLRLPQ